MTTHDKDKIVTAMKKATANWTEDNTFIECFYAIAFEAGRQAEREELSTIFEKMHYWLTNIAVITVIRARGEGK